MTINLKNPIELKDWSLIQFRLNETISTNRVLIFSN